jgi:hypothetical protein
MTLVLALIAILGIALWAACGIGDLIVQMLRVTRASRRNAGGELSGSKDGSGG